MGRLATEKRVELLAGITALDRVRLVIVGAGPAEAMLRQQMPDAIFLSERRGDELAAIYASLDVFVHIGPYETFGGAGRRKVLSRSWAALTEGTGRSLRRGARPDRDRQGLDMRIVRLANFVAPQSAG